jgi:hypothetical protein
LPGRFLGGCGRRVLSDLIDCAASASSGLFDCTPLLYRVQGMKYIIRGLIRKSRVNYRKITLTFYFVCARMFSTTRKEIAWINI